MKTYVKFILAFVVGVISTIGVLYIIALTSDTEENRLREEIRLEALKGIKSRLENKQESEFVSEEEFELTTHKGIVKLHTNMHKDEVKQLMGQPNSVDIMKIADETIETWYYKGSNKHVDEFRIRFVNSQLNSLNQYKE